MKFLFLLLFSFPIFSQGLESFVGFYSLEKTLENSSECNEFLHITPINEYFSFLEISQVSSDGEVSRDSYDDSGAILINGDKTFASRSVVTTQGALIKEQVRRKTLSLPWELIEKETFFFDYEVGNYLKYIQEMGDKTIECFYTYESQP